MAYEERVLYSARRGCIDNHFYLTNADQRLTFSKAVDAVVVIVHLRVTELRPDAYARSQRADFIYPDIPPQPRLAFRQPGFFRFEAEVA